MPVSAQEIRTWVLVMLSVMLAACVGDVPLNPDDPNLYDAGTSEGDATFSSNADGTISNTQTNLTWQQGDSGESMKWEDAKSYCTALSLAGNSDWHLPDKDTLKGLYDNLARLAKGESDHRVKPFRWSSSFYWSSSTNAYYTSNAWYVYFNNGYVSSLYKTNNLYARCVR